MSERPILFNAPMVRAILNGSKTQTRRVAIPKRSIEPMTDECPYGQRGDRLWVREAWTVNLTGDPKHGGPGTVPIYRAEHPHAADRWRPSIHMPRWASRITLEITAVRVERLRNISEADARAEGVTRPVPMLDDDPSTYVDAFGDLWASINGPGSWDANPWVWVIEFRRVEGQR
jgi:hypothetical protein